MTQGAKCRCERGYNGDRCENPACLPDCMNGGECVSPEVCSCKNGYTGARCQRGKFVSLNHVGVQEPHYYEDSVSVMSFDL